MVAVDRNHTCCGSNPRIFQVQTLTQDWKHLLKYMWTPAAAIALNNPFLLEITPLHSNGTLQYDITVMQYSHSNFQNASSIPNSSYVDPSHITNTIRTHNTHGNVWHTSPIVNIVKLIAWVSLLSLWGSAEVIVLQGRPLSFRIQWILPTINETRALDGGRRRPSFRSEKGNSNKTQRYKQTNWQRW